jgi:nitrate/nitrite transporter NarK
MLVVRRPLGAGFLACSGAAGAAVLGLSIFCDVTRIELAMLCAGIALGAVYPVMIGLAGARFPEASGTAAGLVAGAGALGGFVVPWLAGAVGDARGLRAAVLSVGLLSLLLAAAAAALRIRRGSAAAQP